MRLLTYKSLMICVLVMDRWRALEMSSSPVFSFALISKTSKGGNGAAMK